MKCVKAKEGGPPEPLLNKSRREGSGALCPLLLSFSLKHGCDIANTHEHLDHEMTMRWRQTVPWLEQWNSRTEGAGVPGDGAAAAQALGCPYQTSLVRERSFILLKLPLLGALDAAKLIQTHAMLYTCSLHVLCMQPEVRSRTVCCILFPMPQKAILSPKAPCAV